MGNMNVYGDISPRTAAYAAIRLLTRGQYDLVTERFGQSRPLPKKKSKTIKFRRYESLPRATAPLAEGIPPEGRKLTYTDVSATLEYYGDYVEITDVIADTHEDPVFKETFDLCGEQAAETIEVVRIAFMKAGSNVFYENNAGARASVNGPPIRADFRRIYRAFKRNKAQTIGSIVKASAKISTAPVDPAYFVMGHTDLDADIRNMDGFLPSVEYSNSDKALPAEVGKVDQFRFLLTPLFEPWEEAGTSGTTYLSGGDIVSSAASCDVYPLIAVAKNGYAIVPLQGKNAVTPMVRNPNNPTVTDPLGQKGFVSWKLPQTGTILNQLWVARLEAAATAIPS
jgi:N4-gp56 family major capsid protein